MKSMSVVCVFMILLAGPAFTVPANAQEMIQVRNADPLSSRELDQLLAPVALYPDKLLSLILTASAHPLEVVEAARWRDDPENAGLQGDDLASALDRQDWDPSVKAIVPFTQVLHEMNRHIEWMKRLGEAFLSQQDDVMDSAQRLRRRALAAGTLNSNAQQTVIMDGRGIRVEPADTDTVYVPQYDPAAVYGLWPYPDYPPFTLSPALAAGMYYGGGILIVAPLWGWNGFDWGNHRLRIDRDRFNRIDSGRRRRDSGLPAYRNNQNPPRSGGEAVPLHPYGIAPGLAPAIYPGMLSPAEKPSASPAMRHRTERDASGEKAREGRKEGGEKKETRDGDVRK